MYPTVHSFRTSGGVIATASRVLLSHARNTLTVLG